MSVENVKLLFRKLENNEDLQNQLKDLHHKKNEEMIKEIIVLGEKQGIPFTKEEFDAYLTEAIKQSHDGDELSDEELQSVAGGLSGWLVSSATVILCASSMILKGVYSGDYHCEADNDVEIPGIPGL